ncbi:hypothetical protein IV38_GL001149 [Lactobacillus selangorensis]|uniref:CSD domain-containing protein n=1 Tax=Lactobacillus selangorensis TaxID=81857 RepID=A0A0R2G5Z4_9LACO|nr:cold shock domain-containing protein [Lactobacillus selangorensis]KRN28938.1 hypothetical protein IV38_GL001149 [Lactobacillus selangorensis]KRN32652.1 hypothetical protein IV40_GL000704 [Lactobacillus selangorensis]
MYLHGKVTYYNSQKGFGFIRDFAKRDFYFHISNVIQGAVCKGVTVEFEGGQNDHGYVATKIFAYGGLGVVDQNHVAHTKMKV